jgi:hypothetical protein
VEGGPVQTAWQVLSDLIGRSEECSSGESMGLVLDDLRTRLGVVVEQEMS